MMRNMGLEDVKNLGLIHAQMVLEPMVVSGIVQRQDMKKNVKCTQNEICQGNRDVKKR